MTSFAEKFRVRRRTSPPPDRPRPLIGNRGSRTLNVVIPAELHTRLREISVHTGASMRVLVTTLLEEYAGELEGRIAALAEEGGSDDGARPDAEGD